MVGKLFGTQGLPGRLVAGRYLSTRGAIVRWLVGGNGNGGSGNGDHASDADRLEDAVNAAIEGNRLNCYSGYRLVGLEIGYERAVAGSILTEISAFLGSLLMLLHQFGVIHLP